jgi:lysophospholipase L1-like esterase
LLKIAIPLISLLLSLFLIELLTRVIFDRKGMHYGIEMWKYARLLKRKSAIPNMSHEHMPNGEAKLMGVAVKINSMGLRDKEYSIKKPFNCFRLLILGDSMTFGWGTPQDKTYPELLEKMLSTIKSDSTKQIEVINAGVGNYNTVQEVAHFKNRGIQFNPDMVILGFYLNDAEVTPKPTEGFLKENSYLYVLSASVWDAFLRTVKIKKNFEEYYLTLYSDQNPGWQECKKALHELIVICESEQIQLIIVIIPELHQPNENYRFEKVHKFIRDIGKSNQVPVIDLLPEFQNSQPESLWVSPADPHPSILAHKIIANGIFKYFRGKMFY